MPFENNPLNLLVIEDNQGDFLLFETYLQQTNLVVTNLYHVKTLSEVSSIALQQLDLVFLDLSLPDSQGIDSFRHLNQVIPNIPVIVLSGTSDEKTAIECIALGAQDYLLKDDLNQALLKKSIFYSIERKKGLEKLRESNERYAYAAKASFDAIWDWDLLTNTLYRSNAFEDVFGYKLNETELDINSWNNHLHPSDRERVINGIMNTINDAVTTEWNDEYRYKKADGSFAFVNDRGLVLRDDKGKAYRMIGVMQDITKMHDMQQEVVAHQKQLTEATILGQEKQKEEIGKELHDNINQILASVKLYLDIAISNENSRDELLVRCRENTVSAIDEIRKLSHSLIPPSLGDHGLIDAIKELIEELNMLGLFTTHLSIDEFEEAALDTNKQLMLYRIVQEQINNIIKYSKAKEVFIRFKIVHDALLLTISDNGVGFDPVKKVKGIGLKNIESRISCYSGNVQVISSPGKGTSLEIFLPFDANNVNLHSPLQEPPPNF